MPDPTYNELEVSTMPRLSKKAPKKAKRKRMQKEMHKYKMGTMHSGSKHGPMVKSREQAIAIGLSESGQSRKKKGRKVRGGHPDSRRYIRSKGRKKRGTKR
jgi:hypothetical protein